MMIVMDNSDDYGSESVDQYDNDDDSYAHHRLWSVLGVGWKNPGRPLS